MADELITNAMLRDMTGISVPEEREANFSAYWELLDSAATTEDLAFFAREVLGPEDYRLFVEFSSGQISRDELHQRLIDMGIIGEEK
ncbi:MAG: hypothetical protein R3313_00595 [Candidatus Saccharimonadales bacterium]|nr:hypothetical protein [Candidatus Saccharimonadales bacterium]